MCEVQRSQCQFEDVVLAHVQDRRPAQEIASQVLLPSSFLLENNIWVNTIRVYTTNILEIFHLFEVHTFWEKFITFT